MITSQPFNIYPQDKSISSSSSTLSNLSLLSLIPIAPIGAVISTLSIAIACIISPPATPICRGTAAFADWTVALGKYAITQNSLSFQFKFVPIKAINTPIDLTLREIDKINIPI